MQVVNSGCDHVAVVFVCMASSKHLIAVVQYLTLFLLRYSSQTSNLISHSNNVFLLSILFYM